MASIKSVLHDLLNERDQPLPEVIARHFSDDNDRFRRIEETTLMLSGTNTDRLLGNAH
jgi:hypothetical protein